MRTLACALLVCLWAAAAQAQTADQNVAESDSPPALDQTAAAQTASPANVAVIPGEDGVYRLGQVVVIGNPDIEAAGQTVDKVTRQTIEDKNARTLDEALQQLPGIDIRLRKEGIPRLDLRGLPPRHVPLFLNGVPINAASDGQFDPTLIPTENIAEINVIRGTSSVLYGPGALGGVVNIVTKKGSTTPHAALSTEFGDGHERLVRSDVSGAWGDFDAFLSGSHSEAAGYPVSEDGLRDNSDRERNNLFFNAGFTPNDQWSFGINFGYLHGGQGIPPSTINDKNNIFATTPKYERLDALDGKSGQIDVRYAPAQIIDFRATAYVNAFDVSDNIYDDVNYNSMTNRKVKTQNLQNNDLVSGGQFQTNVNLGSAGTVTLALIGKSENAVSKGRVRDVAAGGGNFNFRNVDSNDTVDTLSTAIQYAFSPVSRVNAVLGYAHHWFIQRDMSTRDNDQAMGSVSYEILDGLRLNAAVSQDVRYPSTQELFDPTQGTPNLDPEKSFNAQAGADLTLPGGSHVELTGFRNKVNGFIQNDKITSHYANNNVLLRGVEVSYRVQPLDSLALRTAYSFLDSDIHSSVQPGGAIDLRPEHKIDLQAIYSFAEGWKAYAAATYLAGQTVSSRTLPLQTASLHNYVTADLKLSRSFLHDSLTVYVGADNIFDSPSDIGPGFPLQGRFIFGGIGTKI